MFCRQTSIHALANNFAVIGPHIWRHCSHPASFPEAQVHHCCALRALAAAISCSRSQGCCSILTWPAHCTDRRASKTLSIPACNWSEIEYTHAAKHKMRPGGGRALNSSQGEELYQVQFACSFLACAQESCDMNCD